MSRPPKKALLKKVAIIAPTEPNMGRKSFCFCKRCEQTIKSRTSDPTKEFYAHTTETGERCYEVGQATLNAALSDKDLWFYLIEPKR